jgi:hypothetical protein
MDAGRSDDVGRLARGLANGTRRADERDRLTARSAAPKALSSSTKFRNGFAKLQA